MVGEARPSWCRHCLSTRDLVKPLHFPECRRVMAEAQGRAATWRPPRVRTFTPPPCTYEGRPAGPPVAAPLVASIGGTSDRGNRRSLSPSAGDGQPAGRLRLPGQPVPSSPRLVPASWPRPLPPGLRRPGSGPQLASSGEDPRRPRRSAGPMGQIGNGHRGLLRAGLRPRSGGLAGGVATRPRCRPSRAGRAG